MDNAFATYSFIALPLAFIVIIGFIIFNRTRRPRSLQMVELYTPPPPITPPEQVAELLDFEGVEVTVIEPVPEFSCVKVITDSNHTYSIGRKTLLGTVHPIRDLHWSKLGIGTKLKAQIVGGLIVYAVVL